jgi:transcriptional regulator with XRE-family HTH domain
MKRFPSLLSENLRYLLWRAGIQESDWPVHLAHWVGCDDYRAKELLRGAEPHQDELQRLAQVMSLSDEDLQFKRQVEIDEIDILVENLRSLLRSLARGQKKALAAVLGVDPTTLSRWCSGDQHPTRAHLDALYRYFELPSGVNLKHDPLFLVGSPLSAVQQRDWLIERLRGLDATTLQTYFAALERLLEER